MADREESLSEILEPIIESALNLWEDWDEADLQVVADNVAADLIERGIDVPGQGRPTDDVPTGGLL